MFVNNNDFTLMTLLDILSFIFGTLKVRLTQHFWYHEDRGTVNSVYGLILPSLNFTGKIPWHAEWAVDKW